MNTQLYEYYLFQAQIAQCPIEAANYIKAAERLKQKEQGKENKPKV